jgi:hypothetical protein
MLLSKTSMLHFRGIGLEEEHDPTAGSASLLRQGGQIRGQGIDLLIVG